MDQPSRMGCACSNSSSTGICIRTHPQNRSPIGPTSQVVRDRSRSQGVHELGIFSRQTRWAGQGLGPGSDFVGDLGSPLSAVGRNLEGDPRTLYAANLSTFGKQCCNDRRKSSDLTAEDARKHFGLALVGALVDENAGSPLCLPRPEIAFPSSDPDEA